MELNLPLGITISCGNSNGKYFKKGEGVTPADCDKNHRKFEDYLDRKLTEVAFDRNQRLIELKADLIEHINIKIELLKLNR